MSALDLFPAQAVTLAPRVKRGPGAKRAGSRVGR